ncbi:MoaD/ThiS family protein [Nocardioides campestrisoli]|uniref:MoaD/ThiS family protein n=1 Tax=Nocardioides campestrisoli TaxID=2736757 RepID=UPI0015E6B94F|nr:MoaD/ThiS family protein [Nocardioides campestrisoli]
MEGPEVVNSPPPGHHESQITLRYWAGARHAAGVPSDVVSTPTPLSLQALVAHAVALHPDAPRLPQVLGVCSALVDDRPVGTADPGGVLVSPGSTVEFLPPFAGG